MNEEDANPKRVINEVRPFPCEHCSYKGVSYKSLYGHKKKHHRVEFDQEKSKKRLVPKTFCKRINKGPRFVEAA